LEASKKTVAGADFFAAAYLERFGEQQTAAALYQKHTDDEATAGPAYVGWARCLSSDPADPAKTSALCEVLEKMLAKYPNVSEARNDLAYLNLLEGRKFDESLQAAKMLMTDSPQTLAYRTTVALAELKRGNFESSDAVYGNANIDWNKVNMGWTAIRAAVLGANGKDADAQKMAALVDVSRLRDGEKKLLDQYVYKNAAPANKRSESRSKNFFDNLQPGSGL
jgi:hypothetical protein